MKISKIIACILSLLLRAWITASAAVMMYIQMSVLAYAERGYRAVGGEMLPVAMITVAVWCLMGLLLKEWYKGTLAMLQLRREHKEDERSGRSRSRSKKTRNVVR